MDEGQIVVDSILPIRLRDITDDLARESGFLNVKDLLATARHGRGNKVYLVRFHYLPAGAWEREGGESNVQPRPPMTVPLIQRIRQIAPRRMTDDE